MRSRVSLVSAMITAGVLATPSWADPFFFTTGNADGRLGALSQSESSGRFQTETADDFTLTETTVISGATIAGLITVPSANINNVEIELYHVFPLDSDVGRTSGAPTFSTSEVVTRVNSPADVEIDAATRDGSERTLSFDRRPLNASFAVLNSVVDGIQPTPSRTGGEGPVQGEEVQITITFTKPIVLPAGHYFFRPDVQLADGDFLFLSAATPVAPDLQAWIRNSDLAPDWLRVGTDIIGADPITGAAAPKFNMTFSLAGNTIPEAGVPGEPSCRGESASALATQFGGIRAAASTLGFSSVRALQKSLKEFCNP
jgi:hypothetical protein